MKTTIIAVLASALLAQVGVEAAVMEDQAVTADDLARVLGVEIVKKTIRTEPGHELEIWIEKQENGTNSIPWRITEPGDAAEYHISVCFRSLDENRRTITIHSSRTGLRRQPTQGKPVMVRAGQVTRFYEYSIPSAGSVMQAGGMRRGATEEMERGKEYEICWKDERRGDYSVRHTVKLRFSAAAESSPGR